MNAQRFRPPTLTPLVLLHQREIVDSVVAIPERNTEPDRFDIAPIDRPHEAIASFELAARLLRLELHDVEQLTIDTCVEVERRLPPIVVTLRRGVDLEPIRLLGRDWGQRLSRPIWIRRHGPLQHPILTIGAAARGTWTLDEPDCRLSWTTASRYCSLRLSVDRLGAQLIVAAGCCEGG